jgi:tRNA uridine 5-carboxymethylaminomethyl modification enzyme
MYCIQLLGLKKVEMMRTGYAIEYDVVVPHQLRPTLETKVIANLFYSRTNKWNKWI